MCGTASVQVCLDAGDDSAGESGYRSRWRLLHAIGPVLVAAFANSPLRDGRPTGWRSARQQVWANMDPGRTRAPALAADGDPRDAWAAYALDAELMCVREPGLRRLDRAARADLPRLGARRRLGTLRAPTAEDLDYHLSTLFPPVRPRGHMELRMIDAQPGDGWIVPAAVATRPGRRRARRRRRAGRRRAGVGRDGRDAEDPWLRAARSGPADPQHQPGQQAVLRGRRRRAGPGGRARPDPPGGGRLHRALRAERPMSRRRPTGRRSHDRSPARPGNPARSDRQGTDRRAAADGAAHRQRGRGRPGQTALAADVPAGLGPGPHRQPGRTLAAARGRRARARCTRRSTRSTTRSSIPRAERPTLPLLPPAQARAYGHEVRGRVLDLLERARFSAWRGGTRLLGDGFAFGMIAQHEVQHDETMLITHQIRARRPGARRRAPGPAPADALRLPSEVAGAGRPVHHGHLRPSPGRWTTSGPRTPSTSHPSSSTPPR